MIEKILERLEELIDKSFHESLRGYPFASARNCAYQEAKKIVQEVAKEYGKDTNVRSNADRIRSMSDEELAEFIPVAFDMCCSPTKECLENYMVRGECTKTNKCVLEWLKSEVKE